MAKNEGPQKISSLGALQTSENVLQIPTNASKNGPEIMATVPSESRNDKMTKKSRAKRTQSQTIPLRQLTAKFLKENPKLKDIGYRTTLHHDLWRALSERQMDLNLHDYVAWIRDQQEDNYLGIIIAFIKTHAKRLNSTNEIQEKHQTILVQFPNIYRKGILNSDFHFTKDGRLVYGDKICVPRKLTEKMMEKFHGNQHLGIQQTYEAIKTAWYWIEMRQDIIDYLNSCDTCQRVQRGSFDSKVGIQVRWGGDQPGATVHVDGVGPFNRSGDGNKYMLTKYDRVTRYLQASCLPDAKTITFVNDIVTNWFPVFSIPKALGTDQGNQFKHEASRLLATLFSYKITLFSTYHPQANGPVEQVHYFLNTRMVMMAHEL